MKPIDLTGQKFGRLTVINREENDNRGRARWRCKCECGNIVVVASSSLRSGHTVSCGCYNRDKCIERHTTHGMSNTRLFRIWCGMKERCNNPNNTRYENYGGRGISVYEDWKDFLKFKEWAEKRGYSDELSIDRIDVNGNYCPDNCRWIPMIEQSNNRTNSVYITINNKRATVADWQRKTGLSRKILLKLDEMIF